MKVTLERQDSNQVCLEVEVDAKQVSDTYEKKFREASRRVTVPGFRKGKAPRKLVEKHLYLDALKQEVVENLVSSSYSEALENLDEPLDPITEPKIELVKFDLNEPLIFKATLEVRPEVKLGDYKGLDLKIDLPDAVTDESVEEELTELRKRHGELVNVERPVQENDFVTIDIYGEMEGEPIPQGTTDNLNMEVKPGNFVPGFSEQLVGMNNEEEKEIKVTFPNDYPVVDLREKEGSFKVYVKEIKELKVPELDDEFAKHVGEHDVNAEINNVEQLKERLRDEMIRNYEGSKQVKKQKALIEKIVESSEVEVPKTMRERELYAMWTNSEGRTLKERGVADEVMQASWENWNSREDMVGEANNRIKTTLVLSEIAKVESINISNEELNSELDNFASLYGVGRHELQEQLVKSNRMIPLIDELLSLKIINWLEANSKVSYNGEEETAEAKSEEETAEAEASADAAQEEE